MLIFVIVFFLIFLVGINKICCKDNISRLCVNIHTIWWSLLVVISLLNMFSMKDVSLFTYFLICSYYISFNIGFLMANYVFGSKVYALCNPTKNLDYYLRSRVFNIALLLFAIFSIYLVYRFLDVILISTFAEAHLLSIDYELYGSPLAMIIFNNATVPLSYFSMVLFAFLYLKRNFSLVFLCLFFYITLVFLVGFDKGTILMFVLQFVLICLLLYKVDMSYIVGCYSMNKRQITKSVIFVMILIMITGVLSSLRKTDRIDIVLLSLYDSLCDFLEEIVVYLVGPFRALDYAVNSDYFLDKLGGCYFGEATFLGFNKLLDWIFSLVGIDYNSSYELVGNTLQETSVDINSSATSFNFAFSSILYYYLYFKVLGVITIPFCLGIVLRILINKFHRYPSIPAFALFVYLLTICLTGFFTWDLSKPGPAAYCLYLLFFHYSFVFKRVYT